MKSAYNRGVLIGQTRYGPACMKPAAVIRRLENNNTLPWRPAAHGVPPPGMRNGKGRGWVRYNPDGRRCGRGRVWKLSRPRPVCGVCGRQVFADFELYRSDWGPRRAPATMCHECYETDWEIGRRING
jgi:hypothetical protein